MSMTRAEAEQIDWEDVHGFIADVQCLNDRCRAESRVRIRPEDFDDPRCPRCDSQTERI